MFFTWLFQWQKKSHWINQILVNSSKLWFSFRLWATHALKMERGWTRRSCGRYSLVWKPVQQVSTPLVSSSFLKIDLKKNKYPHTWMMKNKFFFTQGCICETERKCCLFCLNTLVLVVFVLIKGFFFSYSGHSSFYLIKSIFCSFINSHPDPLYSHYHQSPLYSFVFSPSPFHSLPGTQELLLQLGRSLPGLLMGVVRY